jgi:sugar/nucleoside kinase (ribokinase family)
MDAVVLGNVTLDVLCYPVDDVPRHRSIRFEQAAIGPGGCGSNVAVGLCALGTPTALVARVATGDVEVIAKRYWERMGVDDRFVRYIPHGSIAISVGLVDSQAQPRFVHTPGANADVTVDDLDLPALVSEGARALHVAGFFVLPGLLDGRLAGALAAARAHGLLTSLDVVQSPAMDWPEPLWPCLPDLDIFLCNTPEAQRLTGESDPATAARALRSRGGRTIIIKLGDQGCWVESDSRCGRVPAPHVAVVDTTGAGDAFAAGLIAALLRGETLEMACRAGNDAGARIVGAFGAVAGWFEQPANA